MTKWWKHWLLGAVFVGVIVSGCTDKSTEPYNDAPRSGHENSGGARIGMMPDGFSNWATKCDHGNRVYVIYKGDDNRGAIAVVAQDPPCNGDKTIKGEG